MRDFFWRALLVITVAIGAILVILAGISLFSSIPNSINHVPQITVSSENLNTVSLPMVIHESPYPIPEGHLVGVPTGSLKLIVGAALLVIIIVGGVVYGRWHKIL